MSKNKIRVTSNSKDNDDVFYVHPDDVYRLISKGDIEQVKKGALGTTPIKITTVDIEYVSFENPDDFDSWKYRLWEDDMMIAYDETGIEVVNIKTTFGSVAFEIAMLLDKMLIFHYPITICKNCVGDMVLVINHDTKKIALRNKETL